MELYLPGAQLWAESSRNLVGLLGKALRWTTREGSSSMSMQLVGCTLRGATLTRTLLLHVSVIFIMSSIQLMLLFLFLLSIFSIISCFYITLTSNFTHQP